MASENYEIKDKVFLVTGGAAGIGAGVAEAFLENGAKHVAALDIDVASGTKLEKKLCDKHGPNKYKFYKCDVTTDLEKVYDAVLKEQEYIDVVVNCAGIMNDDPNVYLKEIAVNLTALITSSFKAFDIMRKDHGGRGGTIINISSIVALFNPPLLPVYAATKSAVLQFSTCLGMEPHYSRTGVRVLTMCFGCTDTSLFSPQKMGSFDRELNERLAAAVPEFPFQTPESAIRGLLQAYKVGKSSSTWLVTTNRPAEDISKNVTKAYEILAQGVFDQPEE